MSTCACVAGVIIGVYLCRALVVAFIWPNEGKEEYLRKRFPYSLNIIAHRGGSLLGPENTMYAFCRAIREGKADMLEMDVHRSKDGQIVVSHDETLERTCGERYKGVAISDLVVDFKPDNFLPQCQRRIPLFFKTKETTEYIATDAVPVGPSTRVCLLSEVFDEFPNTPMHIDVKEVGYDVVMQVLNMIESYKRESITFIGSSSLKNASFFQQYFRESTGTKRQRFRVFANSRQFLWVYLCYYCGILPFIKVDFDVFSIPVFTQSMREDMKKEQGSVVTALGAFFLNCPGLWTHLQRRGIPVIGWVLNTEADFQEACGWPLNGIMTDDPVKLRTFFDQFGCRSLVTLS